MTRTMRRGSMADLPSLVALERATFDRPWSAALVAAELAKPFAVVELVEERGQTLAWCCSWHLADEAHVLRIATTLAHRRGGLARDLLRAVVARAQSAGARRVGLEVGRETWPPGACTTGPDFASFPPARVTTWTLRTTPWSWNWGCSAQMLVDRTLRDCGSRWAVVVSLASCRPRSSRLALSSIEILPAAISC